jgi:hypothetical protein
VVAAAREPNMASRVTKSPQLRLERAQALHKAADVWRQSECLAMPLLRRVLSA